MDAKLVLAGASIGWFAISQTAPAFLVMFATLATVSFMVLPSVGAAAGAAAAACMVSYLFDGSALASILSGAQFGSVTYLLAAVVRRLGGSQRTAVLVATSFMVGLALLGLHYTKKKSE